MTSSRFGRLLVTLEQPTHAARATVFAGKSFEILTYHQIPIETYYPKDGWAEQNPMLILEAILECIEVTLDNLKKLDINSQDIISVGITNQRETVVVWDSKTGKPLHNAIVWMDTRCSNIVEKLSKCDRKILNTVQENSGIPLSTYSSAPKLVWLLENCSKVKTAVENGTCKFGTIDSWLIWNLTGGNKGGIHITDVTNASRTMLMNLNTQTWDPYLYDFFNIPACILPSIKSCSEKYGYIFTGSLTGIPITGVGGNCNARSVQCLGDQQAALVGHLCLKYGEAKCTFGMGAFLLCNTGTSLIRSKNGLISTVAYKFGPNAPTIYALEGSNMIAGVMLDWLKNEWGVEDFNMNKGIDNYNLENKPESKSELIKKLNSKIDPDCEGSVYFAPAFTGLYAPYWCKSARGVICGISSNSDFSHIITAALRALGFQTRAILEALSIDCKRNIDNLLVDGMLASNMTLMQVQADICGVNIIRPVMPESSALGAAMASGCAAGIDIWPMSSLPPPSDIFFPMTSEDERDVMYNRWNMAIKKSYGWITEDMPIYKDKNEDDESTNKIYSSIPAGLFLISSYFIFYIAEKFK